MERALKTIGYLFLAAVVFGGVAPAAAEEFPLRPIRIIVPYPAGGPSDTATRILAESLSRQLGQQVIVDSRSGGAGQIGTEAAIRAEHDGYTLLVGGTASLVLLPAVKPNLKDLQSEIVPLTQIWYSPQILAVRSGLGITTLADLLVYAKANPGKLTFGSAGTGTVTHLAIMLFAQEAGVEVTHVPYRSTALWLTDAIGDRIDAGFGDLQTLRSQLEAGTIKPLAITAAKRMPQFPKVPSLTELGLPGVQTENWFGLVALARTPRGVLDRLKAAVQAAQADPAYAAALAKVGGSAGTPGPEAFSALIANDTRRFSPIIRSLSIKAD